MAGRPRMVFYMVLCSQRWVSFPKIFCSLRVFWGFSCFLGFFLIGVYTLAVKIHSWFKFLEHVCQRDGLAGLFLISGIFSFETNLIF